MIDLTGPPRPWPEALAGGFGDSVARALACSDRWSTPQSPGDPALLDRLGELFGAPEGRTRVTGGVRSFASAWAGRTATAIIERPSFSEVPEILAGVGPLRREPWDRMAGAAAESAGPATLWLTTPARNPDGRSLDGAALADLAKSAEAGHQVVLNQVYRWFAPNGPVPEGVWTVTSFAKLCGGGSRLGWAVAPSAGPCDAALRACAPSTVWQRAWADFLSGRVVAGLLASCVEPTLDARKAFTARAAELLGWEFAGAGPSVVLVDPEPAEGPAAVGGAGAEAGALAALAAAGVSASPGAAFGMPVSSLRLAFSGASAPQAREAAERIARAVERTGFRLRPPDAFQG
ncbi:aminotransferase class I/II-fold pyridoxal phosphate-dependent enzyme [Streptacidiphilus cavernicola]|uniref:Aminotransferase class I/II-fold pyridoxal phosphate-dependent enzyme n=1 Tax=Streptacidiphilus cavernicola TaxID=3342716 RepID=A0ABV6VWB1_9ACTN